MPLHWADDCTGAEEFTPARPPMDAFAPSLPLARSYLSALRGSASSKSLALDDEWTAVSPSEEISGDEWIVVKPAQHGDTSCDMDAESTTCPTELADATGLDLALSCGDATVTGEYQEDDDADDDSSWDEFDDIDNDELSLCSRAGRLLLRAHLAQRPYWTSRKVCDRRRTQHLRYFQPASNSLLRLQEKAINGNGALRSTDPDTVASPYHDDDEAEKPRDTRLRDDPRYNRKDGEHRRARKAVQRSRGALDAATRPAMAHANSSAHRTVLIARAHRKAEIRREVAARAGSTPRHLRKTSTASRPSRNQYAHSVRVHHAASRLTLTGRTGDPAITISGETKFDSFRHRFFDKYRHRIASSLSASHSARLASIRLCPIAQDVQNRFMHRLHALHSADADVPLVFHGTAIGNMDSICRRGLLVPGEDSGIRVVNGSALGVGIYSALTATTSLGYTRGGSTMFVCAALTKGSGVVTSGDFVVLKQEERICPLFLLDFDWVRNDQRGAPYMRVALARALLRRFYSKKRMRCAAPTETTQTMLQPTASICARGSHEAA